MTELTFKSWEHTTIDEFMEAIESSAASFRPWIPWCQEDTFNHAYAEKWLKCSVRDYHAGTRYNFAVYQNDYLVGCVDVRLENDKGIVGYWIIEQFQNRGIGTVMLSKMIEFSKGLGLKVLHFDIATDNIASISLVKKFNPAYKGSYTRDLNISNEVTNLSVYEINLEGI